VHNVDAELRQLLEEMGKRIDATYEEARAARQEAQAARQEAQAARQEAQAARQEAQAANQLARTAVEEARGGRIATESAARVIGMLGEEYKSLNKLVADINDAQIEFARQVQALGERLGRIVQMQIEIRTQETSRFTDLEQRVGRLERAVEQLRPSDSP
jgi:DNA replication initiation complex subunit (GINS family)